MSATSIRRLVFAIVVSLLVFGTVHAAGQNVGVLRVESLDAALEDIDRILAVADVEVGGNMIYGHLEELVGLGDLSWVDRKRPLGFIFPMEGMMLGEKGLVALLPVQNPDAAREIISKELGSVEADEQGILAFTDKTGEAVIVTFRDGYLVAGSERTIVAAMEPDTALTVPGLPPGTMALDVHLEPVAPIAQMGLQAGRGALEQEMNKPKEEGETTEEGWDAEDAMAFADIYFNLLRDTLNNASRLQISIEVGSEAISLHKRLTPIAGSTLHGLIQAQKGGLPDAARYIDPAGQFLTYAGQMTLTPAFTAALKGYVNDYVSSMKALEKSAAENTPEAELFDAWLPILSAAADRWEECYRGDGAGAFGFDGQGRFAGAQLYGVKDAAKCRAVVTETVDLVNRTFADQGGEPMMTFEENALQAGGVSAWRQVTHLEIPEEEASAEFMDDWFGADGMVSYVGVSDAYMLNTMGPDAEAGFRGLVERVGARKKAGSGLTPSVFAPVEIGPGFYVSLDLAALLTFFPAEDQEDEAALEVFRALPEGAGRIVEGIRFEPDALRAQVAVPFALIEAFVEASLKEAEAAAPAGGAETTEGDGVSG